MYFEDEASELEWEREWEELQAERARRKSEERKLLVAAGGEVYLHPNEVAERLAVSPSTVRRLIMEGDLRAVRVLSLHRIPESALKDLALVRDTDRSGSRWPESA